MGMKLDLDRLKRELTPNEIINIIKTIEPDITYEEIPGALIFPTVCHNLDISTAKKKLYYYFNEDDSPLFCCYTECNDTFDIYELVKKMLILRDLPTSFIDILNIITRNTDKIFEVEETNNKYSSILINYRKKNLEVNFSFFNPNILHMFPTYYYYQWIEEGITIQTMKKYGIRFSINKNQIIIPHYNSDSQLVGIRCRNLGELDLLNGNKYMPVRIEGKWYSHSLSYNLYGLNFTKEAIAKKKMAFIFEGEKSVMICDSWYGDNNISVATCGNRLNKIQLNQLRKLGVRHVVLCYDRMNEDISSDYFQQLLSICNKYKNYMDFSFIYDRNHLLEYKAAPVDSGKVIFEQLLNERVIV